MAKKFAGFTPAQLGRIFPELEGMQADEQALLLASNLKMQGTLRSMMQEAQKRVSGSAGFNDGGMVDSDERKAQADFTGGLRESQEQSQNILQQGLTDADQVTYKSDVVGVSDEDAAAGTIDPGAGQLDDDAPKAESTKAEAADTIEGPEKPDSDAYKYDPSDVTPEMKATLSTLEAATGKVGADAIAAAAQMDPEKLAQLGLTAAQINQAQSVIAPDARTLKEGELIDGSTVDMDRVKSEVNFAAATGAPSTDATVQGQLTGLMEQFEGTAPPAWAAGAMRAASAQMAARGLSASSMAGQAIVQAAMESALPIAQADARTVATFEAQNLSNRQQAAMFAAEKRAQFLNLEFNQEFQARVQNAAKISDIANMNFSAEQQIALENARLAQSVDIANLNARNAKILADAAAMSQVDMANLNNRQQAQVQNAKSFLQMDLANLSNEQQMAVIESQALTNALLSDTAAQNAAKQFNASSQQQSDQFFANLSNQIAMFNTEQSNAMAQFNAGEENAMERFNSELKNQRDMFNAQNSLVIEQANAQWYQSIATAETAAINESNLQFAQATNNMTSRAFNEMMQQTRDLMSYVWQAADSDADRAVTLLVEEMRIDADEAKSRRASSDSMFSVLGGLLAKIIV